jgi:hypothetical protein
MMRSPARNERAVRCAASRWGLGRKPVHYPPPADPHVLEYAAHARGTSAGARLVQLNSHVPLSAMRPSVGKPLPRKRRATRLVGTSFAATPELNILSRRSRCSSMSTPTCRATSSFVTRGKLGFEGIVSKRLGSVPQRALAGLTQETQPARAPLSGIRPKVRSSSEGVCLCSSYR